MKINVRSPSGLEFSLDLREDCKILDVKRACEAHASVEPKLQKLIYKGKVLEDGKTLAFYNIKQGDVLHLIKSFRPTTPVTTTPAPTPTPTPTTAPPLPGMMNGMMNNPDIMRSMMNSPMMQSLMNNPDTMRSLITSNPQLRRLMETNPELNHVLNDPDTLRQAMRAMQDPSVMEEMVRSQDRAMSNISNHPRGFDALRRIYRDIQEPMMSATQMGSSTSSSSSSSHGSRESTTINNTPLSNPWSSSSSSTSSTGSTGGGFGFPSFGGGGGGGNNNNGGIPGMPGFPVGMDPRATLRMMQDPVMQRMWDSLVSDPEALRNLIRENPHLQRMTESSPGIQRLLQNPDRMRQFFTPEGLASMEAMLPGNSSSSSSSSSSSRSSSSTNSNNAFGGLNSPFFQQMLNTMSHPTVTTPPQRPLSNSGLMECLEAVKREDGSSSSTSTTSESEKNIEDETKISPTAAFPVAAKQEEKTYETEIQELRSMGFDDDKANLEALKATDGDVDAALGYLLGGL